MTFTVITLFPSFFEGILASSMLKLAQESGKVIIRFVDIRDFGEGKHKVVDDKPYGGGRGMILKVDVLDKAIQSARINTAKNEKVILLDPRGETFTQSLAEDLSKLDHIILIAGHYEGYDERVRNFIDSEISIGDFVLTGGEIPAMAIIDATTRLIEGAILDSEVTQNESFSKNASGKMSLEHPQYTRPQEYKGQRVPEELLTGDHKNVQKFRNEESIKITQKVRPDLLKN